MDGPDTLQDLCIFYLMNNLDILLPCLNKMNDTNEGFESSLTTLLGNRMLEYYNLRGTPCDHEQPFVDELVKKFNCCTDLSLNNQRSYTHENLMTLAMCFKSVKNLYMTCFDSSYQLEALSVLCKNNLSNLSTVVITQKCEEDDTIGCLNLLGGKDFDSDLPYSSGSDDDSDDDNKAASKNDGKAESKSTDGTDAQENTHNEAEMYTDEKIASKSLDNTVIDMKSFSYYQVYSGIHPNIRPCRYFGWFYSLLSGVISRNPNLQSIRLVTMLSNPIEWFLSRPDVAKLQHLQSLSLSFEYFEMYAAITEDMKIPFTISFFTKLPTLRNLRHLDISCNLPLEDFSEFEPFLYAENQVEMFVEAVKEMPQLKSLDISGTNLATIIRHSDDRDKKCRDYCMPGFEGRRFEFLGLYGTEACTHRFIPADRVSGNASIDQLIEALMTLQHNSIIMSLVLKDISSWIQEHTVSRDNCLAIIDGFIMLMTKIGDMDACRSESEEFEEKTIVTALEVTYKLVVDNGLEECFTVRRKRLLLDHLMTFCDAEGWRRKSKTQLMEYSILLIVQLKLGNTALYSYRFKQFVQVLQVIFLSKVGNDKKVHAINELYTVCSTNQEYKIIAGTKLNLVQNLLKTVEGLLIEETNESLNLLRVWKVLGTLTDEIPCNCELFVQNKGCQFSKLCIDKYPYDKGLHKMILGILVDVSENSSMSSWLMVSDMMTVFRQLLLDGKDTNVRFLAAGLLLRLVSYGAEIWTLSEPTRDSIIMEIDKTIETLDVNEPITDNKFNKSLSSVLSQIENYSLPVQQHWAAWLLANLISATPETFCDKLKAEDGLSRIEIVLQHGGVKDDIVSLLQKIKTLTCEYRHQ